MMEREFTSRKLFTRQFMLERVYRQSFDSLVIDLNKNSGSQMSRGLLKYFLVFLNGSTRVLHGDKEKLFF